MGRKYISSLLLLFHLSFHLVLQLNIYMCVCDYFLESFGSVLFLIIPPPISTSQQYSTLFSPYSQGGRLRVNVFVRDLVGALSERRRACVLAVRGHVNVCLCLG